MCYLPEHKIIYAHAYAKMVCQSSSISLTPGTIEGFFTISSYHQPAVFASQGSNSSICAMWCTRRNLTRVVTSSSDNCTLVTWLPVY